MIPTESQNLIRVDVDVVEQLLYTWSITESSLLQLLQHDMHTAELQLIQIDSDPHLTLTSS